MWRPRLQAPRVDLSRAASSAVIGSVTSSGGRITAGTPSISVKIVRRLSWRATRSASGLAVPGLAIPPVPPSGCCRWRWVPRVVQEPEPLLGEGQRDVGPRLPRQAGGAPCPLPGASSATVGASNTARIGSSTPAWREPADQASGQQRMAAEFEEVVVEANALEAETSATISQRDISSACAARRSRRDEAIRRGQRLAVELAVGRERQRLEDARRPRAPCSRADARPGSARSAAASGIALPRGHQVGDQALSPARLRAR